MNTLKIEAKLAEKYGYEPLEAELSKKYRQFFRDNLPDFIDENGSTEPIYTLNGTLICNGYDRVVIGDYGAFIEFNKTQANSDTYIVKPGEEYRINDKNYSKNVKYHWYTVNDGSDIKIYLQKKKVTYADYKTGRFYISPHEVKVLTKPQNKKDWTGNKKTTFVTLGASNHTDHERAEHDYYATEPIAADLLLNEEHFDGTIWENACGEGHLSKPMAARGYEVISTDLIDRGFGKGGVDFFKLRKTLGDNIITNPPYAFAREWVEHSLELLQPGKKLALFLPIQFLESDSRRPLFNNTPPQTVYVCSNRILCGMNGDFSARDKEGNVIYNKDGTPKKMSSAKCYAWFVWVKDNYGVPQIKWIN